MYHIESVILIYASQIPFLYQTYSIKMKLLAKSFMSIHHLESLFHF